MLVSKNYSRKQQFLIFFFFFLFYNKWEHEWGTNVKRADFSSFKESIKESLAMHMWNPGNKEIFNKAHLLSHYYKIGWIYFNWFYIISRGYILIFAESFFEWDQWMTWVFVLGIEGGELSKEEERSFSSRGRNTFGLLFNSSKEWE